MPVPVPTNSLTYQVLGSLQLAGAEISAYDAGSQRVFTTSNVGLQIVDLSEPDQSAADRHHRLRLQQRCHQRRGPQRPGRGRRHPPNRHRSGHGLLARRRRQHPSASSPSARFPTWSPSAPTGPRFARRQRGRSDVRLATPAGRDCRQPGRIDQRHRPVGRGRRGDRPDRRLRSLQRRCGGADRRGRAPVRQLARLFGHHRRPGPGARIYRDRARWPDGLVTLQEANAVAILDLSGDHSDGHRHRAARPQVVARPRVRRQRPRRPRQYALVNFQTDLDLFGMYMPDAIASYLGRRPDLLCHWPTRATTATTSSARRRRSAPAPTCSISPIIPTRRR